MLFTSYPFVAPSLALSNVRIQIYVYCYCKVLSFPSSNGSPIPSTISFSAVWCSSSRLPLSICTLFTSTMRHFCGTSEWASLFQHYFLYIFVAMDCFFCLCIIFGVPFGLVMLYIHLLLCHLVISVQLYYSKHELALHFLQFKYLYLHLDSRHVPFMDFFAV